MKTFSINFWNFMSPGQPLPATMVMDGIPTVEHRSGILQIQCGSMQRGVFAHCDAAATKEFRPSMDGSILKNGEVCFRENYYPIISRSTKKNDGSILVHIQTRNKAGLPIYISEMVGGKDGGVVPVIMGTGYHRMDNGSQIEWNEAIFVIAPHSSVVLEVGGVPYLAIANSGGLDPVPVVMSWEEYHRNFQPHLKTTASTESVTKTATTARPHTPDLKVIVRDGVFDGLGEFDEPEYSGARR